MYREEIIEPKIIEAIREANQPVTVGWIAVNLGIAWATARNLLRNMVTKKKLKIMQTSRTAVFFL